MKNQIQNISRRAFVQSVSALTSTVCVGLSPALLFADEKKGESKTGVKEVSPVEDLMREHGGLNRILLIYEEALRRFRAKEPMDPVLLQKSAKIVHDFIENYHEKLEEEHLFPRLKKAGRLIGIVDTLEAQHRAGRKLTTRIMDLATPARFKRSEDLERLESAMTSFIRMYRPHEAREDTVIFPEFKKILTPKEYDRLGGLFEDREHELFGKEGFDGIIDKIAHIEKALEIHDLGKFTPKA